MNLHLLRSAVFLYHESMIHDRDLHALRAAVFLYHESAILDRDLHALRAAVLWYFNKIANPSLCCNEIIYSHGL